MTLHCYAVIFTSQRSSGDDDAYQAMAQRMEVLARTMPGFIDIESVRDSTGLGITVSYWADLPSISAWRAYGEHLAAQQLGRETWYAWFKLRICKVESSREFPS